MIANLLGALFIAIIIYYVGRVLYKKLNADSDCGSCSSCDQSCPFAGGNYDIDVDLEEIGDDKNESDEKVEVNEVNNEEEKN